VTFRDPTPAHAAAPTVGGTGTGFWSAKGSQLVDATGAPVRMTGINWFGMETANMTFHGLWSRPWKEMIDQIADTGYNTLRIPFSNPAIKPSARPVGVDSWANPDLQSDTSLQILDKVINYAGTRGMRVLLDRHRPDTSMQSPLWYTSSLPESTWISDWKSLATRYKGNTTVIGADLHNEPHAMENNTGACWGCGDEKRDWRLAAERAGNAILQTNPDWLIVVEGVSCPSGNAVQPWQPPTGEMCGWWGGNLTKAKEFPVRLSNPKKLVYSPHEYATSVFEQEWFKDAAFPSNLPAFWDSSWGYLHRENIAPLILGEFGTTLKDPRDRTWLRELMKYLGKGIDGMSFTYWSWNPNSGDTGGILNDDWKTINQEKHQYLAPYLIPGTTTATG
jgi:endoglucanase